LQLSAVLDVNKWYICASREY